VLFDGSCLVPAPTMFALMKPPPSRVCMVCCSMAGCWLLNTLAGSNCGGYVGEGGGGGGGGAGGKGADAHGGKVRLTRDCGGGAETGAAGTGDG
jgi:hypothetical protein